MNAAHLHLLLNHVPVLGTVFATLLIGYALARRSDDVTRAGLWVLGLVGAAAVVVYLTGEPAEELVEGLPGFSEAALERHERVALWATVAAGAVGVLSLLTLYVYRSRPFPRRFGPVMLVVALGLSGIMGWTANLGGQVRHEEVRGTPADASAPGARAREGAAGEGPGAESGGQRIADGAVEDGGEADGRDGRSVDDRRAIVLPAPARATLLREMRQMLEALGGVLRHAAAMDRPAMKEAALSGGTRIAVDRNAALMERLPDAFVRLGFSTHRGFDSLAAGIGAGMGRDTLFARLSGLTGKCVSCHAAYRVVAPGDGD